MKRLFLLLAVFGFMFTACESGGDDSRSQIIKFQDENAKFICTLHWDENEDGELSYKEAAAVTDIGMRFQGSSIEIFTELRNFTGLKVIANNAFQDCADLLKVSLPEQVTAIGASAFNNCANLLKINIPNSVTSIGGYAFKGCASLESVTIGDGVTEIGISAFYRCTSLKSVYCKPITPPKGGTNMFSFNDLYRIIYVPLKSLSAYKSAIYWNDYSSSIGGYDF